MADTERAESDPRPAAAWTDREVPRRRRSWPVLLVFGAIVACQFLVAAFSIDVLSSVRAYAAGESLYSKGQKDAQIYLVDYADYHREDDYRRFLQAIAAPGGYRVAREELQKEHPDFDRARRGFAEGGSDPSDFSGAIRLFRLFHRTSLMAGAIETWSQGDAAIEDMRQLAVRAHERILAGDLDAPTVVGLRDDALRLNQELTALESRFAARLSEGARLSQRLLIGLNATLAALLGVIGLGFVRYSSRVQAATEDEVRRRQESLQRLLDSSAEGLYGVGTDGRCTFINLAALRMLGYEREDELLGRDIHARIHHSDAEGRRRPAGESRITRAYRERHELHLTGEVLWRRDGSSFPVEYWSHPILEGTQLLGAVVTFFDITDRLSMQAAVRQGEVRMAGLVDAVNDGVITVDAADRIVLFNRAAERLFGMPAAEAIGSDVDRLIPRRIGKGRSMLSQEIRGGAVRPGGAVQELIGVRANGEEFALEASMSALDTDRGSMVTAVLRDVTDLRTARAERQAREALEASSRAKSEFLSRMSHELRTPLNAVLGFSQLLRLDATRPPSLQQLERIQHIENAGAHLLALVNDVLDLSRVESGQMAMTLEAVELRPLVDDALAMVMPLAADAGVALHRTVDTRDASREGSDDDVFVRADRLRLRQVLVNLLSNAVKYNRAGGEVRVGWRVEGGRSELRVVDNGVGMTPDKLARLFEPFNRLGAERSSVEGTGIGLVLSRRLAELMHGELRVESAIGRGTVATLLLDAADEPSDFGGLQPPPSQHGDFEPGLRVLYAEDNEVNVALVQQIFSLRPSVVLDIADDGASALAKSRLRAPDLMLVDMNLGDMTGFELAQAIWADPRTASIRLVALSADALPEQIQAALEVGFECYLTKPINFRELLTVLDEHIAEAAAT